MLKKIFLVVLLFCLQSVICAEISCPQCDFRNADQDRYCLQCNREIREMTAEEKEALRLAKDSLSVTVPATGNQGENKQFPWGWLLIIPVFVALLASVKSKAEAKRRKSEASTKSEMKVYLSLDPKSGGQVRAARRYSRKEVNLSGEYEVESGQRNHTTVTDLSLTGAGFLSDTDIPKETKIFLHLKNAEQDLKLTGLVMNVKTKDKKYLVGIQFFHLFKHQEAVIEELLK